MTRVLGTMVDALVMVGMVMIKASDGYRSIGGLGKCGG